MHPHKLARLAWKTFAVLLLVYYVTDATIDYLARATVTSAEVVERQEPPTAVLCASLGTIMDYYPSQSANRAACNSSVEFLNGRTAAEILDCSETLAVALEAPPHTFNSNTADFLLGSYRCAILNVTSAGTRLQMTKRARQLFEYFKVMMSAPRQLPHGLRREFDIFNAASYLLTEVRFARTITHLLAWPWPSNCFDYGSRGLESQHHCLQECAARTAGVRNYKFLSTRDSRMRLDWVHYTAPGPACHARCARPDCYDEHYVVASKVISDGDGAYALTEQEPATVLRIIPVMTFDVYLYYISALINTCVGVSVLDVIGGVTALARALSSRWRRALRACCQAAKIFAVIGAVVHSAYASLPYLEYETSSEYLIGELRDVKSFTAHLCFDVTHIGTNNTLAGGNASSLREVVDRALALQQIVHNISTLTTDWKWCQFQSRDIQKLVASGEIETFFKDARQCFSVPSVPKMCPNPVDMALDNGQQISFHLAAAVKQAHLYLTGRDEYPWTAAAQRLASGKSSGYNFIRRTLLPRPFASACVPGFSRAACRAKCLEARTGKLVIAFDKHFDRPLHDVLTANESEPWREQCVAQCTQAECVTTSFRIVRYNDQKSYVRVWRDYTDTTFVLTPKVALVEFLLIVTSVLALWLGFAAPLALRIADVRCLHPDATFAFDSALGAYRSHLRHALKLALVALIAGAFVVHLHSVCDLYLQRDVITETTVSHTGRFNPLDISIAIPIAEIWRTEHVPKDFFTYSAKQLSAQTFGIEDIMPEAEVAGKRVNMSHIAARHVTTYFARREKYFRFSLSRPAGFDKMAMLYGNKEMLQCDPCKVWNAANRTLTADLWLHITAGLLSPRASGYYFEAKQILTFYVAALRTTLLPHPFATNCVDYVQRGHASQSECLNACVIAATHAQLGFVPAEHPRHENNERGPVAEK